MKFSIYLFSICLGASAFAASPMELSKGPIELDPNKVSFAESGYYPGVIVTSYEGKELSYNKTIGTEDFNRRMLKLKEVRAKAIKDNNVFVLDLSKSPDEKSFLTVKPQTDLNKPENQLRIDLRIAIAERDAYKKELQECLGKKSGVVDENSSNSDHQK